MYSGMHHEQVVYQNPFLAMRIWQIDCKDTAPEAVQLQVEQDWRQKQYAEWHYHEEVEFLLILKGELTAFCTEERLVLRKGDICLFGSSEPHRTIQTKDGNLSYLVFQIDLRKYWDQSTLTSMRHFSEVLRPLSTLNYIYRECRDARTRSAALIRDIFKEMNEGQLGYELAVSSRIKDLLLLLLRHDERKQLNYSDNQLAHRLQPAIDYVEERLGNKLSVVEVSSLLNMSYTHFIKTFKKAFGMSFIDFVSYKRIRKAEQQLLTSDISIAEVAEAAGVSNLGHFYDLFQRYNDCSPKQFRDRHKAPALSPQ
ncbi:AraC family transcriptional regulator [Paenibacillus sp. MY03]|uniref:AraC family transcriptional regulator n=1 Tax=Paenibacillus sp. MY03 TaxID=302980 RepID=UPI0015C5857E|nr:AraC family transcriptional regulator [Paenibacillus sp. MY03]